MSIDNALAPARPSPAADVTFSTVEAQHAESSSQAQSRSSSAKRSSHSITKGLRLSSDTRSSAADSEWNRPESPSQSRIPQRIRKHGGFLLGSVVSNVHTRSPDQSSRSSSRQEHRGQNGHLQLDKRRSARVSGESMHGTSPLSREVSSEPPTTRNGAGKQPEDRQPAMDPAQLVQMALNLSESRRRHASSTLPVPISPANSRRVVSAMDSGYGTVRSASSMSKRASYSNESRIPTPTFNRRSLPPEELPDVGSNIVHTFSPATLARADKARRYFELGSEHRRLLESLPPLRPDVTAPGNFSMQATSSPGTVHYYTTRIASAESGYKYKLGRAYNPLQALRNRRIRNRERRPLTAPTETFQETDRIRRWIDGVEAAAKDSTFRPGEDQVRLPPYSGELEYEVVSQQDNARGHRRNDTVSSMITRAENGWTIEPAELLADTYWVEKGDNKTLIQDRRGNRIFPARVSTSLDVPRRSEEAARRSFDANRNPERNVTDRHDSEASADEERPKSKHKHKHILPLPRLGRGHVPRSRSISSASSDEGRLPPALRFGEDEGGDENIGPLERHMREMIAKDAKGELSSPELLSPDHWGSQDTSLPVKSAHGNAARLDQGLAGPGKLSIDTQRHQRSVSEASKTSSDRHLLSMNEVILDSPSSPLVSNFSRQNTSDTTASKTASPVKHKSRGLKLPLLHSRSKSKEQNRIGTTDFANNAGAPLSPVLSADSGTEVPRSSTDSARPTQFRRHQTSDSIDSELRHANTSTSVATSNAKTSSNRFFKGGRVRDIVRNESSRMGERFRGSREGVNADPSVPQSDASDIEAEQGFRHRATDEDGMADDGPSPRASLDRQRPKSKYFTSGLPSFKSPAGRDRTAPTSPLSEDSNPFEQLQVPSRPSQRGLPRIHLPDDGNVSEPEMSPNKANKGISWAADYSRRRSVSQNDLTLVETNSGLANMKIRNGNAAASGKRHWSISDNAKRTQAKAGESDLSDNVSARDIARVRTLLLASGIKAQQLCSMAETPRDEPTALVAKAAEVSGRAMKPLARKEEYVEAARWLSGTLEHTISGMEKSLQHFQAEVARDLTIRLETLSHKAGDQLTKHVHETSDEADAFNVELTTRMPQDLKRMDTTIDSMFRARRKNFKLLINIGSKLFEWLLLGIMWSIWFVVVVVNSIKKAGLSVVAIFKWLLWF